jgi:hypothetical protein
MLFIKIMNKFFYRNMAITNHMNDIKEISFKVATELIGGLS